MGESYPWAPKGINVWEATREDGYPKYDPVLERDTPILEKLERLQNKPVEEFNEQDLYWQGQGILSSLNDKPNARKLGTLLEKLNYPETEEFEVPTDEEIAGIWEKMGSVVTPIEKKIMREMQRKRSE